MVCDGPECVSILNVAGLDDPVKFVRGVGPNVSEMLAAKGIQTAEDLLYHLPFRYEDRQNPRSLDELKPGETKTSTVALDGRAFSYYDADAKQWRADPGEFQILVGRSSQDIQLRGSITLSPAAAASAATSANHK